MNKLKGQEKVSWCSLLIIFDGIVLRFVRIVVEQHSLWLPQSNPSAIEVLRQTLIERMEDNHKHGSNHRRTTK